MGPARIELAASTTSRWRHTGRPRALKRSLWQDLNLQPAVILDYSYKTAALPLSHKGILKNQERQFKKFTVFFSLS